MQRSAPALLQDNIGRTRERLERPERLQHLIALSPMDRDDLIRDARIELGRVSSHFQPAELVEDELVNFTAQPNRSGQVHQNTLSWGCRPELARSRAQTDSAFALSRARLWTAETRRYLEGVEISLRRRALVAVPARRGGRALDERSQKS